MTNEQKEWEAFRRKVISTLNGQRFGDSPTTVEMDADYIIREAQARTHESKAVLWKSSESAPRDGTVFWALQEQTYEESSLQGEKEGWLHLPRLPFTCKWVWNFYEDADSAEDAGSFVKVDCCGLYEDHDDIEPAYWQPLSEPPKEQTK